MNVYVDLGISSVGGKNWFLNIYFLRNAKWEAFRFQHKKVIFKQILEGSKDFF